MLQKMDWNLCVWIKNALLCRAFGLPRDRAFGFEIELYESLLNDLVKSFSINFSPNFGLSFYELLETSQDTYRIHLQIVYNYLIEFPFEQG